LFLALFFLCAFSYNYFEVIDEVADGIHVWRQSDGLSIAYKYYSEGIAFFETEMHNRLSGEGKAVGEFPGMYYLVALLYHVFGVKVWVYRGLWLLITFLGYFSLFKFCSRVLQDPLWGILIALFTFTSPILIVYGISFIPDPIALAFLFISWYFMQVYWESRKWKHLVLVVFFTWLSAVLKITCLISIIALIALYGAQLIRSKWQKVPTSKRDHVVFVAGGVTALLIFSWYAFASCYNDLHSTTYFFLRTAPIWEVLDDIDRINESLQGWLREYFYKVGRYVVYVFAILLALPFFNRSSLGRFWYFFYLLCILGFISFALLFSYQFIQHDYYVIGLLFVVPLTVLLFVKKYQFLLNKRWYYNRTAQLLFAVLLVFSVLHGTERARERFAFHTHWLDKDLYDLRDKLADYGIDSKDLVLVPHDPSPNITLYAINMNGWTGYNFINKPKVFKEKVKQGARWMIVSDSTFYNNELVLRYKDHLVLDYKGVRIYDVQEN
jgi:hypothetical protein